MLEPHCFCGNVHAVAATEKFGAIAELIGKAGSLAEVDDLGSFYQCVVTREKAGSTALGRGVAVAHGRTPLVSRVIATLGISRQGIDFGSPEGLPVHLLFLVASPPERHTEYLMALSAITSVCRRGDLRERLLAAPPAEAGRLLSAAVDGALRDLSARAAGSLGPRRERPRARSGAVIDA